MRSLPLPITHQFFSLSFPPKTKFRILVDRLIYSRNSMNDVFDFERKKKLLNGYLNIRYRKIDKKLIANYETDENKTCKKKNNNNIESISYSGPGQFIIVKNFSSKFEMMDFFLSNFNYRDFEKILLRRAASFLFGRMEAGTLVKTIMT